MFKLYEPNINMKVDLQDIDISEFKIEDISTEKMFNFLRKPILEDHPEHCNFKGKLTPFFLTSPTELDDEKDLFAVDTFLLDMYGETTFIKGDFKLFSSREHLIEKWFSCQRESKHFGFIDISKKSEKDSLLAEVKDSLMIGKKGKVFNAEIENPKQQEREPISNKKYPNWFEPLYALLSQKSGIGSSQLINIEAESKVSLYQFLNVWIKKFIENVSQRNIGVYIDQITNFYSRISGSYNTTVGKKTTHGNIAAIPLKIVTTIEGKIKRWITGVAFRGPHHMRSATDKCNLLIVEKLKDLNSIPEHFYSKFAIIKAGSSHYIIRKEAIKKIDGIHLTFIKNSTFIACNMIGDIIMRHRNFQNEDAFKNLCASHLTNDSSLNFFIDRVIDATLMAVIGNSRDEGYLSIFRKFLMILINRRRQQNSLYIHKIYLGILRYL